MQVVMVFPVKIPITERNHATKTLSTTLRCIIGTFHSYHDTQQKRILANVSNNK